MYVPGVGFRSANALRMRERTVVEQGERALAVMSLVSSEAGTEVAFEIKDDRLEDECLAGRLEHRALWDLEVHFRDGDGNTYARIPGQLDGIGLGQHEFGFFSRRICFEALPADVRRAVLQVDGALGAWTAAIDLLPIVETGVTPQRVVDRTTTKHAITVRLVGIALREEDTMLELDATWGAPIAAIHAIGAMMQRRGDDRLVLVDGQGRRYVEELAHETTQRPRADAARTTAKFPPLAPDATELTLTVPSIVVEESDATLEFTLPIHDAREVRFGPYPMRLGPASVTDDLLEAPGQAPGYGVRFVLGPVGSHAGRRALRPMRMAVDGVENNEFGWGWHPEPGMRNFTIRLKPGASPMTVTLSRPMVSIRGPWEIRFERG